MTDKEFCELCFLRNEYCAERVIFPPEDGQILETLEFTVTYKTKSEKGKISGRADARSVTINGEKRYCCHPFPTLENILRMVKDFKEQNEDKVDEE